ncbi:flagellar biosynthetic protein FliR [Atlantibacter hermannii]|uniref:flagellar biosynthetic protein FliR n=2 Tax=Atlantibacter hermannii TaxID=565 RepID=UPI000EC5ABAB|nr:flagellar biosynthetic protein FliR [Atlantibacter hermannii]HAI48432.1 flagellar biosynthetic protein FliR [Enterobacteriaceae bacterium]
MQTTDVLQYSHLVLALWYPFVRILAFVHFAPIFDNPAMNVRIRIIVALGLSIVITPMIDAPVPEGLLSLQTVLLTLEQIVWGVVFGLMMQFVFLALQLAGQILSFNMGMSMAVMNDPASGASTTVLSEFIYIYAALLFFIMNGHLLLVSILYKGFIYWPIGNALNPQTLRSVALALGWVLSAATLLAMPTTFIMLVVQMGFGFLNRVSPALNLFSLGFPVNMLAGLCCFAALLYALPDHYLHLTNNVLHLLDTLRSAHVQ